MTDYETKAKIIVERLRQLRYINLEVLERVIARALEAEHPEAVPVANIRPSYVKLSSDEEEGLEQIFKRYHISGDDVFPKPSQVAYDIGWLQGLIYRLRTYR